MRKVGDNNTTDSAVTAAPLNLHALQKASRVLGGSAVPPAGQPKTAPLKKNPIHSLITTLPVIMLLAGLGFYYAGEKKQRSGEFVLTEMRQVSGVLSGLSEQGQSANSRRIVWIKTPERLRGGRLDLQQFKSMQQLATGQPVDVWLAPRVPGSSTFWVVRVVASGDVVIDQVDPGPAS